MVVNINIRRKVGNKMAKKTKKKTKPKVGEKDKQLDLIDVHPKNAKPIIEEARLYKKYQTARLAALKKEVEQKQKVLELVKKANLQRLKNGQIKFEYDGVVVSVTPQDDKVAITEKTEKDKEKG